MLCLEAGAEADTRTVVVVVIVEGAAVPVNVRRLVSNGAALTEGNEENNEV